MKPLISAAAVSLIAFPAVADPCLDEISALFDGGAMDPFARPPHVQYVTEYDAEGKATRNNENYTESPMRTIAGSGEAGHFTMAIDTKIWNGPTPEGPWTDMGQNLPENREEMIVVMKEQSQANLTDTACHGAGDDGLIHYTYRTQTNPDENGTYFGALNDIWINPETGLVERMQMAEFINSWSEGVSDSHQTIRFEYDPELKVMPPE